uniref:Uncharacterized protein n=1 Tax=Arundo donax TaxID=35708 RepID=A0A0A8YRF3_ARUDO
MQANPRELSSITTRAMQLLRTFGDGGLIRDKQFLPQSYLMIALPWRSVK